MPKQTGSTGHVQRTKQTSIDKSVGDYDRYWLSGQRSGVPVQAIIFDGPAQGSVRQIEHILCRVDSAAADLLRIAPFVYLRVHEDQNPIFAQDQVADSPFFDRGAAPTASITTTATINTPLLWLPNFDLRIHVAVNAGTLANLTSVRVQVKEYAS